MAGRAAKGGAGMTKLERQILEDLGSEGKRIDRRRLAALAGGGGGGAAAASGLSSDKKPASLKKTGADESFLGKINAKMDEAAFSGGNQMAKQTAKRYVRGAMRSLGLDPDKKEDRAKAALGGGAAVVGAHALGKKRQKDAVEKQVRAALRAREAAKPSAAKVIMKALRRGR